MSESIYPNAPLVEVIVEIRWQMQPLFGSSGAAYDPHFRVFSDGFLQTMGGKGFSHVERLVPEQVPLEVLPHRAVLRYRKKPDEWPVVQIGPGVLTVNMMPPYGGWTKLKPVISEALEVLWATYPMSNEYLSIDRLSLNYVNAFTHKHAVQSASKALREQFKLVSLPSRLSDLSAQHEEPIYSGTIEFMIKNPRGAYWVLRYGPGKAAEDAALILRNQVVSQTVTPRLEPRDVLDWFLQARSSLRTAFDALVPVEIRTAIGSPVSVKEK